MSTLPVLPLADTVLLPGMVIPVTLDPATQAAIDAARTTGDNTVLAVPRLDGEYGPVGTVAVIERVGRLPSGEPAAVIRGLSRARIGSGVPGPGAALWVESTPFDEPEPTGRTRELAREYKSADHRRAAAPRGVAGHRRGRADDRPGRAGRLGRLRAVAVPGAEVRAARRGRRRPPGWSCWSAGPASTSPSWRSPRRSARTSARAWRRASASSCCASSSPRSARSWARTSPTAPADYRTRVEQADLPEKVREAALREVGRLERASDASPEAGWIRTWLDTVLEMPWNTRTEDNTDLAAARAVLDADHAGLADVKDRILEYLAVRNRRAARGLQVVGGRGSGAVLALVGPPGVGKTSLGESVARALGRKFVRVSLGGVRDEAEIRGHRRTYVGALPGRIVRAIREAGSMNPVVLLDEVDKLAVGYAGDPAAALLEVLDPAQNHTFRDHYLEVDLDLSDVLFLATANVADTIPGPLLDRMEVVTLDGYTESEKVAIARDHLWPRQLERAGLTADEVRIDDDALALDRGRAHPGGGRTAARAGAGPDPAQGGGQVAADRRRSASTQRATCASYLGRPRFTPESAERTAVPGVATGLAVTGAGGDVLFIEATAMPGEAGTDPDRPAR